MKSFLLKSLLFLPVFILGTSLKPIYHLQGDKYKKEPKHSWVYTAIKQANAKNTGAKIVVIGDSVGNQFFNVHEEHGKVYSLTCTAAIDIVGQYLLLHDYLENNQPETVIIMNSGFRGNLNAPQVFHHFLKPFYKSKYKEHFTDLAWTRIREIPYYFLSQVPHFLTSTWGPKIPFVPETTNKCISPLTVEYLKKMEILTKEKGVNFMAISPPLNSNKEDYVRDYMKEEVKKFNLEYIFRNYFDHLEFQEASQFRDAIHLHRKYVKEHKPKYVTLLNNFIKT